MKQEQAFGINWIVAGAFVLASASAIGAGNVNSAGSKVNEVYGRAGVAPAGISGSVVHVTRRGAVSEVDGRGSRIAGATPGRVDASNAGVDHFGRGSAPTIAQKFKAQGATLAQTH